MESEKRGWHDRNAKTISYISMILLTIVGCYAFYSGVIAKHDTDVTFDFEQKMINAKQDESIKRLYQMMDDYKKQNEAERERLKEGFERDI